MCSCTPGFVLMAHSLFPFVLVSINACTVEITPWHCHNMHENQMRLASATNLLYQWIYDSSKNALSCFYLLKSFQTFQVLVVVDGMPSKSIFITKCFQNKEALGRDNKTLRWQSNLFSGAWLHNTVRSCKKGLRLLCPSVEGFSVFFPQTSMTQF